MRSQSSDLLLNGAIKAFSRPETAAPVAGLHVVHWWFLFHRSALVDGLHFGGRVVCDVCGCCVDGSKVWFDSSGSLRIYV